MTKTLCFLKADEYAPVRGQLMGFTVSKDGQHVKVYDNWVNRIVLNAGLPTRQTHTIIDAVVKTGTDIFDKLEDFQLNDVRRMQNHPYSLNRNKMGAGKTVEFIALCQAMGARSILVCCPKAVIAQWVAQFKAWWPERADDVYAYAPMKNVQPGDIVVTNYEKISGTSYGRNFKKFTWDMLGVDEAHMIKNHKAHRTIALKSIPARFRNAMTGTPVLRNPDDLYSILQFLNPDITGGSYWNFVEYFCNIVEDYFGRHVSGLTKDEKHVAVLQRILDEISVYNEIEVAQGKKQITVPLDMIPAQRVMYNKIRRILLDELPPSITIPNGAVQVTRLLQTTSCPRVFNDEKEKFTEGVKFDWLLGMLKEDPNRKVVVYSKFAQVVMQLKHYLVSNGIKCSTYTGQQNAEYNEREKECFVKFKTVQVLAGTIDALGTGIDGLQAVCNTCVFIDRDYRPGINEQAEDRLHRKGQDKLVLCYYLECNKTVDMHVAKLNTTRSDDIRKLLKERA